MTWPGTLPTWLAGKRASADALQDFADALNTIGEPWTAWTPVWTASTTNPTIGNGSLTGRKLEAGKLTFATISIVFGSTTTVGVGTYAFTTPSTMFNFRALTGNAELLDASASVVIPRILLPLTTTAFAVSEFTPTRVAATSPITWATGDRIDIGLCYEAV